MLVIVWLESRSSNASVQSATYCWLAKATESVSHASAMLCHHGNTVTCEFFLVPCYFSARISNSAFTVFAWTEHICSRNWTGSTLKEATNPKLTNLRIYIYTTVSGEWSGVGHEARPGGGRSGRQVLQVADKELVLSPHRKRPTGGSIWYTQSILQHWKGLHEWTYCFHVIYQQTARLARVPWSFCLRAFPVVSQEVKDWKGTSTTNCLGRRDRCWSWRHDSKYDWPFLPFSSPSTELTISTGSICISAAIESRTKFGRHLWSTTATASRLRTNSRLPHNWPIPSGLCKAWYRNTMGRP